MRGLAVVVLFVACGDNTPPRTMPVGVRDGSILFARTWESEGAATFRGWYDRSLDIECSFLVASDGSYRCLPARFPDLFEPEKFADAACTHRVELDDGCHPTHYVLGPSIPTPSCGDSGNPVVSLGATLAARSYFARDQTGACSERFAGFTQVIRERGVEVDPSVFVGASFEILEDRPLSPYAFVADDGAVEARAIWDTVRNGECASWRQEPPRCRPSNVAFHFGSVWADAACSEPAAQSLFSIRSCAPPTAVVPFSTATEKTFREIGTELSPADIRISDEGTCTVPSADFLRDERFYLEGEPIPDETFPALTQVFDGVGRIRALRHADSDGRELAVAQTLYDYELDAPCEVFPHVDGTLRCLVQSYTSVEPAHGQGMYGDADCTIPLAVTRPTTAVVFIARYAENACDETRYEMYSLGPEYLGPVFVGNACTPVEREPVGYFTLGPAVDLPIVRAY